MAARSLLNDLKQAVVEAGPGGEWSLRFGSFLMPSHPPERSIRDGQRWDLDELERLDALGFKEAWIGEHFTAAWEPCPAPDLLIAQAPSRTKQIRLGPLGHLLPYHHPVELTHRVAWRRGAASSVSASAPCRPLKLVRPAPTPETP